MGRLSTAFNALILLGSAQWDAAKKPATVHHETRQQRRDAERKAAKEVK